MTGDKDAVAAKVTKALKDLGLDEDVSKAEDIPTGGKNIHSRKSGCTRTTEDLIAIVKYVHWPHFGIYKGPSRKPAAYDLSMPEFVAGYVNCLLRPPPTTTKITCSATCKISCMTPQCTHGATCATSTGSCLGWWSRGNSPGTIPAPFNNWDSSTRAYHTSQLYPSYQTYSPAPSTRLNIALRPHPMTS